LIQLGGINIISFATFFATFYKNSAGLRTQSILKDLMATDRISDNRTVLQKIILFSLLSELIGATLLFLTWAPEVHWHGLGEKMFFSLFHSVSAFNNAGFGLFTDNLYDITMRHAYYFQLVICVLIFFGGIGFLVMEDLFSPRRIRERYHYKWKKLAIGSKIAIHTSLALVVAGTIGFYLLEKNNALQGYSWFGALVTSIFQSVTTRTAGFNSIDFSKLGQPILILMMLLMFIGASPGSTGGGIKTTTFTLILRSAWATIRGKKNVEMYKHSISYDLIDKSYSIVLFSLILIFLGCFMLSIAEPSISFIRLLFEEISAFGTVGLSTGITPGLSDPAKLILIGTMYVGRIGTLTLALALTRKAATTRYRYPQTSVMVG
jgi:Trk-type K+ transport system membrane component